MELGLAADTVRVVLLPVSVSAVLPAAVSPALASTFLLPLLLSATPSPPVTSKT